MWGHLIIAVTVSPIMGCLCIPKKPSGAMGGGRKIGSRFGPKPVIVRNVCKWEDGTLLIGAPGDDNNTCGRAFLFERDQVGNWNEIKVFTLKDGFVAIDMGSLLKLGLSICWSTGRNDRGR